MFTQKSFFIIFSIYFKAKTVQMYIKHTIIQTNQKSNTLNKVFFMFENIKLLPKSFIIYFLYRKK